MFQAVDVSTKQRQAVPAFLHAPAVLARRFVGGRELWALSDQALVSGANFATNLILARSLGLSGFGVYALSWTVVLLMSGLQMAIIISPMMTIAPKQESAQRALYFGAVTAQELCFAACSAFCLYVATLGSSRWFPSWHVGSLAVPLAAATGAFLLQDFARRYFFVLRRSRHAMMCDALSYLTQLPLLWWLGWRKELTTAGALWILGATSLFSVMVSLLWREEIRFSREMTAAVARRHWAMVRWLVPSAVLQWTSQNLILVFAPVYYGAAAAGALRACQNIVAIAHIWFLGLENVVPAEASRQLHEHGVEQSLHYIWKVLRNWGLLTLGFMLLISAAPSVWLRLLYGAQYTQFGYVLRLYSLLYLITFVGVPLRAGLQAVEYVAPTLWSYAVTTIFAAVAAGPLARHFGLVGVLLGLVASQILFQTILSAALILRTNRMRVDLQRSLQANARGTMTNAN